MLSLHFHRRTDPDLVVTSTLREFASCARRERPTIPLSWVRSVSYTLIVTSSSGSRVLTAALSLLFAACGTSAGGGAGPGGAGRSNGTTATAGAPPIAAAGAPSGTGAQAAGGTAGGANTRGGTGGQAGDAAGDAGGSTESTAGGGRASSGEGGAGLGGSAAGASHGGTATGGLSGSMTSGTPTELGLASLPMARQEHGVVALRGEVYVLGGYTPDVTASVLAYDPTKDSWRSVADFPSPFNHPAAAVVDDELYVAGFYAGTSLTGPATGRTFVYDPDQDDWTEKEPLPAGTERAGGCVAVLGTSMYVFGGGNSGAATAFASVYDTVADSWQTLPPLPETREHCAAFTAGGKLYIAGGRTHTIPEFRPSTLEFDPAAGTYTERTPIPTPRGGAASAVLGGRLFLFGGEGADNQAGVFPDIQAYDASTDSWETFPPMTIPRHGFGAATLGERIYLPGGAIHQGGSASDVNTVFSFEE